MEVQECPGFEVQQGQTHRQKFFQTIYYNPPEGGGSIILNTFVHYIHAYNILSVLVASVTFIIQAKTQNVSYEL